MVFMTFALERPAHFLNEKRIELYEQYCSRVSQLKNALGAKNTLQSWTLFNLERCGV